MLDQKIPYDHPRSVFCIITGCLCPCLCINIIFVVHQHSLISVGLLIVTQQPKYQFEKSKNLKILEYM